MAKRRQGVAAMLLLVEQSAPPLLDAASYSTTRNGWPSRLNTSLDRSLRGLEQLLRTPLDPGSQKETAAAISEMHRLAAEIDILPLLRPHVQELRGRKNAVRRMLTVVEKYLESFCAGTPGLAQTAGREAQLELDASYEAFEASNRPEELRIRLEATDMSDPLASAMKFLSVEHAGSLLGVDVELAHSMGVKLRRHVAVGQGANYGVARVLASAYLDLERFEAAIAEASALMSDRSILRALASEPGALGLLRRARNAIVESTMSFSAAFEKSKNDEARLRRIMNLYAELFEDGAAPLFAWYLRVAGVRKAEISSLVKKDASELLRSVQNARQLEGLFLGADLRVRHAASHSLSYELRADEVHFSTRSFEGSMSADELVDLLFAMLESVLAAFWVLDNELAAIGAQGHTVDMTLLGVSLLGFGETVLETLGGDVVEAAESDGEWSFRLSSEGRVDPFILALSLAANPPQDVGRIRIEYPHLPDATLHIPRSAADSFARFKDLGGLALIAENLEFLSTAQLDGHPALTADHLRSTANIGALALLHHGQQDAIPLLRRCLALARTTGAQDVALFVEDALTEWRGSEQGRLQAIQRTMRAWADLPVPALPQVRETIVEVGD